MATCPWWKYIGCEKWLYTALHMNRKNMLRNCSPRQLLHELILVVVEVSSCFSGLLPKAVRHCDRRCVATVQCPISVHICSTEEALVTICDPYDTLTWLKRLSMEGLGALQRLWINIGSYTMQSVKLNLGMMRLPGLLQYLMRLPGLLNQCPDLDYLYIGRQRPKDKKKRLGMKQAFEERSHLSAACIGQYSNRMNKKFKSDKESFCTVSTHV